MWELRAVCVCVCRSIIKAICVMTPILGLAWVFGVLAVNEDTLVFQVLFVVFNSLQVRPALHL